MQRLDTTKGCSQFLKLYAAINWHLELTLLKGQQIPRHLDSQILRSKSCGIGESSPDLFLHMVNLYLIISEAWWILNKHMVLFCGV